MPPYAKKWWYNKQREPEEEAPKAKILTSEELRRRTRKRKILTEQAEMSQKNLDRSGALLQQAMTELLGNIRGRESQQRPIHREESKNSQEPTEASHWSIEDSDSDLFSDIEDTDDNVEDNQEREPDEPPWAPRGPTPHWNSGKEDKANEKPTGASSQLAEDSNEELFSDIEESDTQVDPGHHLEPDGPTHMAPRGPTPQWNIGKRDNNEKKRTGTSPQLTEDSGEGPPSDKEEPDTQIEDNTQEWECPCCTYGNEEEDQHCVICDTEKQAQKETEPTQGPVVSPTTLTSTFLALSKQLTNTLKDIQPEQDRRELKQTIRQSRKREAEPLNRRDKNPKKPRPRTKGHKRKDPPTQIKQHNKRAARQSPDPPTAQPEPPPRTQPPAVIQPEPPPPEPPTQQS